ncbi:SMI1/KNR4 family protein [Streptomyces sp. S.PB5]|uniref:SMI1/KNR4 family protein n=1 Tax=Streptomyces sp. S.PB5 TaxID=3020844 RepID=UPI0025B013B3|nr:SMI1/KNR4 family protein [Streptomyces sp. S.PB5]MDN3029517.1 SMI1/KNR4 family protein [Streptomyces sp. S.PB5]
MSEEWSRWYRGRLVVGPFTPFEPGELAVLEQETGAPLPASYRSFLEAAGGASLSYTVRLPACEAEPLQSFDELHRLGRDGSGEYGHGTLLGEYRRCKEWRLGDDVRPSGLLPIARNGGGDTLFLDLDPAACGRLHAFVHGIAWPGRLRQGVLTEVSDDFDSYLDDLFVTREAAEDVWADVAGSEVDDPWRLTVEAWLDREVAGWRADPWAAAL